MNLFLMLLILAVLLIIMVFSLIQLYNIAFRGFAPFISTKFNAILAILKELNLSGQETVYELGAGKAGFLRAIEQKFKNEKLIGIEYAWWPYCLARMQIMLSGSKIKLIRNDIFKVNLKEADIIYCFLSPKMMDLLEKKFRKECRPGTLIISYHFRMKGEEPEKVIKENKNSIYFYRI
ncbi:MAG: hypothetical protein PHP37_01845 [Patescibacteria group bacterium]|nr:hypothetical protein [Patescibacteria group bacterium]